MEGANARFNKTPEAINEITGGKTAAKGIFNIAGQKLSVFQKGLNIVDGKKVLVKKYPPADSPSEGRRGKITLGAWTAMSRHLIFCLYAGSGLFVCKNRTIRPIGADDYM